ncbi:MAG: pyridoxamine 5'-phosphate oxidase family protein [Parvibaculum sp.]
MSEEEKKEAANKASREARSLVRAANKGALGTFDPHGFPLVTLVALATREDGAPLLLLSRIAGHTQNVMRNPRVSLMVEGPVSHKDPMLTERLTIVGTLVPLEDTLRADSKRRFTQRHPSAEAYDTELDFSYFRLEVDHARFNQGFGAFTRLRADQLVS